MATVSTALQAVFDKYDISTKELVELSGIPRSTIFHWESDRSEPHAHRLPKIANALDLMTAGGGTMLLNLVFDAEFGPSEADPLPPSEALQLVFSRHRTMKAAKVAEVAHSTSNNLSNWKHGVRSPKLHQALKIYRALDVVRPGAGRLFLMHLTGREMPKLCKAPLITNFR